MLKPVKPIKKRISKEGTSLDVYFSTYKIAKILCPLCGAKRFHIESRHNGAMEFWCRGKNTYQFNSNTHNFEWKPNGCPWRVMLSKGDLMRAAIRLTEEAAKQAQVSRERKNAELRARQERERRVAGETGEESTELSEPGQDDIRELHAPTGQQE